MYCAALPTFVFELTLTTGAALPLQHGIAASCDRCVDSQRKLSNSLTLFSRQFEDERKIMDEAKQTIDMLVGRAIYLAGGNV